MTVLFTRKATRHQAETFSGVASHLLGKAFTVQVNDRTGEFQFCCEDADAFEQAFTLWIAFTTGYHCGATNEVIQRSEHSLAG